MFNIKYNNRELISSILMPLPFARVRFLCVRRFQRKTRKRKLIKKIIRNGREFFPFSKSRVTNTAHRYIKAFINSVKLNVCTMVVKKGLQRGLASCIQYTHSHLYKETVVGKLFSLEQKREVKVGIQPPTIFRLWKRIRWGDT